MQVGAVIDAIPRITADANGNFTEIAFYLINAYDYEVQDLYDGADNARGQRGRGAIQHGAFRYRGKPYGRITEKKERQQLKVAVFQCVCERLFVRPVLFQLVHLCL